MKLATLAVAVVALSSILTGCAKARAAGIPEGPPLAMPAPPPRVLIPAEEEPLVAAPTGPDIPLAAAPRVTPPPVQSRRATVSRAEPDGRVDVPPAAATAQTSVGPAEPVRELLTVPAGAAAAETTRVHALLKQAETDRKKVESTYNRLSTDNRKNFDDSKRFSEQALEKLKERNMLMAVAAAEKAATLAASLVR